MRSVDQKEFLGGQGTVHFDHVLEAEEMHGMNRVYAKVTLQKGCSVGYHVHNGDGEDYYVIKGTAYTNGPLFIITKHFWETSCFSSPFL